MTGSLEGMNSISEMGTSKSVSVTGSKPRTKQEPNRNLARILYMDFIFVARLFSLKQDS